MKPDTKLIAKVFLLSVGFVEGERLGKKIASVFSVLSDLLAQHRHYHFGLRTVIAVLTRAGRVQRESIENEELAEWAVDE